MFIKHLTLSHFRNHELTEIEFETGATLFLGPNGMGKTNVVEAIEYASTLSTHRTPNYQPLIRGGNQNAIIRIKVSHADRDVLIDLELHKNETNKLQINKSPTNRLRDVLGIVQTVMFTPNDIEIVKHDPTNRRAFMDALLVQLSPRMAGVLADYDRVLKQRNSLLKTARSTGTAASQLSTLDAWDESLVKFGSEIIFERLELMRRLEPQLKISYSGITNSPSQPSLSMKSSISGSVHEEEEDFEFLEIETHEKVVELFQDRIKEVRQKELDRGITLIGPQRDDLILNLGEFPAKGYASNGESWSYALALRLASAAIIKEDSKTGDPILILDDVFAELDTERRTRLAELVSGNEQILITAAAAEDVPSELNAKVIRVSNGVVSRD